MDLDKLYLLPGTPTKGLTELNVLLSQGLGEIAVFVCTTQWSPAGAKFLSQVDYLGKNYLGQLGSEQVRSNSFGGVGGENRSLLVKIITPRRSVLESLRSHLSS